MFDLEEYRVTKYNPDNRNSLGDYLIDEWTSFSDIGKKYEGKIFTMSDYIKTENNYIKAINNFMKCTSTVELKIVDLEVNSADLDD